MVATSRPPLPSRRSVCAALAAVPACPAVLRAQSGLRFRLAHNLGVDQPVHAAMEHFAAVLLERSGGEMRVDIFADGELGQEAQTIEFARRGTLDIIKVSGSAVDKLIPGFQVFSVPYVFRDKSHWRAVMTAPPARGIMGSGEREGLVGLTFFEAGARSFYGRRPIGHPDDIRGWKIRIQASPTMARFIELHGAQPVTLAWSATYATLRDGLVDGAENSLAALVHGRHGEVIRYYASNEHTRVPDVLFFSARRWEGLTPAQRTLVREAAESAWTRMNVIWDEFEASAVARASAMGVTFMIPDRRAFVERAAPLRDAFATSPLVGDLMRAVEAV